MKKTLHILDKIVQYKKEELLFFKKSHSFEEVKKKSLEENPPPKHFFCKSLQSPNHLSIIAEIKKASPSAGIISKDWNPVQKALSYEKGGAQAISVLTDSHFFQGSLETLKTISKNISLPLLRKDFIFDPYQIFQSRLYSASAILLIADILTRNQLQELHGLAIEIGMDVLVEIHNEDDWSKILDIEHLHCVGINSRNLHDFSVDISQSFALKKICSKKKSAHLWILESGCSDIHHFEEAQKNQFTAALVGTHLMTAKNPDQILKQWFYQLNQI